MDTIAPPIVMVFSGHDPSGGAGVQADISTLSRLGCHPCSVITALTIQDSRNVKDFTPVSSALIIAQARAVLEDLPVAAFKIGMTGSIANVEAIHTIVNEYPDIPLILDPVIAAGGGGSLAEAELVGALNELLIPYCSIITPNTPEARLLCSDADTLDACAQQLMAGGADYVLITGGHEPTDTVVNRLWGHRQFLADYRQQRLPGEFHGTGCSLASAIAGYVAHGSSVLAAVRDAQTCVSKIIAQAQQLGHGQKFLAQWT